MRVWLPLVLVLAACGGSVGSPGPSAAVPPEARAALEQVYVDGRAYTLQADLYRDLMPGPAPTPKRGVGGSIFLRPDGERDVLRPATQRSDHRSALATGAARPGARRRTSRRRQSRSS